ncbi:MAG: NifB/NifX family molybdenum-iron cluster-binding protein [Candidatus Wallbacteria bacterium]
MLIAITAQGAGLESPIDEKFGRAPYIVVYDLESNSIKETIDNSTNCNLSQGAGIQTASKMAELKVNWVLTGHVGPKAEQVLNKAKIKIGAGISGNVKKVIDDFNRGIFQD